MMCSQCGKEIAATARFCPACGAGVSDPPFSPGASLGLASARIPPQPVASAPQNMMGSDTYLLVINGQQSGPYTIPQMKTMWQSGNINAGTVYWQSGMTDWQSLANIRHFLEAPSGNQFGHQVIVNQQVGYAPAPVYVVSAKSRVTFILLGLIFGYLGAHNFYAGYSGKGIAQLLISVCLGWVFGVGFFITWCWMLIEIIVVTTDAQGVRMS